LQTEMWPAAGWLRAVVVGACLLFVWNLRQCHRDAPGFAVANDVELDRRIRRHRADGAGEVTGVLHLRAIDRSDDIAGLDPDFRGGATALRLVDHRARGFLQA